MKEDNDRDGRRRRPSLEREDAFCDANTFKPLSSQQSDDAQVAQLYQMGLLYDEKDSESLNLNTIQMSTPTTTATTVAGAEGRGLPPRMYSVNTRLNGVPKSCLSRQHTLTTSSVWRLQRAVPKDLTT